MDVKSFIIADRDYAKQVGNSEVKALFVEDFAKVAKNTLADPKSEDRASLAVEIDKGIASGDIAAVQQTWTYIVARQTTFKEVLTEEEKRLFANFVDEQATGHTFILQKGAIEAYLPAGSTSLEQTIELVSGSDFDARMSANSTAYQELKEICTTILAA